MMALPSLKMPGKRLGKQTKGGVGLRGSVRVRTGDNLSNGLAHSLRPLACAKVGALLMPKAVRAPAATCFLLLPPCFPGFADRGGEAKDGPA